MTYLIITAVLALLLIVAVTGKTGVVIARVTGALDTIPAWLRHFTVALLALGLLYVAGAVKDHGGIVNVGIDWGALLRDTLNSVAVAAAAIIVLALTPFTQQYGLFKNDKPDTTGLIP